MASAIMTGLLTLTDSFAAAISSQPLPPTLQRDFGELRRTLTSLLPLVGDAEEREIRDPSFKLWLSHLRSSAFDAEDAIDELNYKHLQPTIAGSVPDVVQGVRAISIHPRTAVKTGESSAGNRKRKQWQVRSPGSSITQAAMSVNSAFLAAVTQNIKGIRERFDGILRDGAAPGEGDGVRRIFGTGFRAKSTGLSDDSSIFGRESEEERIVGLLLGEGESSVSNVSVIPIVGMGGVGKTALAQLVYGDNRVVDHFMLRLWVCVSEDFDVVRLTKETVEAATGVACGVSELDQLQFKLKNEVAVRKYLLVLDDVWSENREQWQSFVAPLLAGAKGSKILMTTRNGKVSEMAGTVASVHLDCLTDDHCWEVFSHTAFEGRAEAANPKLVKVGKKISLKCKGLPLAAKTVGGLLQGKEDEGKWDDVLKSDIWDLDQSESNLMSILTWSYLHLPAPLKRCFAYFSIFPKDYRYRRSMLVHMWMAQGFIQSNEGRRLEDVGNEYFDDLLSRSFIQNYHGDFVMHDLIHDLAQSVYAEEFFRMEKTNESSRMVDEKLGSSIKHVRHSSVMCTLSDNAIVGTFSEATSLRTFTAEDWPLPPVFAKTRCPEALSNLFLRLKFLRVLCITSGSICNLPDSIRNLKCLRYISLNMQFLGSLPESIGCLYNLQTLELLDSCVEVLPRNISSLINLRHLILPSTRGSFVRTRIPSGIGRLTNLQSLSVFNVHKNSDSAKLGELKNLNLHGELNVALLKNVVDAEDVEDVDLWNKPYIDNLELSWGWKSKDAYKKHSGIKLHRDVFQYLQPHSNLEVLKIRDYLGGSFPSWVADPSYSKLHTVEVYSCHCPELPPFGQLPSLKHLIIDGVTGLETIGRNFFNGGFPSLQKLQLSNLVTWKEWCGAEEGEFPCLTELIISSCPNLSSLVLDNLIALKSLLIRCCNELLSLSFSNFHCHMGLQNLTSIESLKIDRCHKLQFSPSDQLPPTVQNLSISSSPLLTQWCLRHHSRVKHIQTVRGITCPELILDNVFTVEEAREAELVNSNCIQTLQLKWDPIDFSLTDKSTDLVYDILEILRPSSSLSKLLIMGYYGLRFAGWLGDASLSNLVKLRLFHCLNCEVLPPLGQLRCLTELHLEGMHGIKYIGHEFYGNRTITVFPSLRILEFMEMNELEQWEAPDAGHLVLRQLRLRNCCKLRGLPLALPALRKLELEHCCESILESVPRITNLFTLRISQFPTLKEFPNLPPLMELIIENCMGLTVLPALPSLRNLEIRQCNEEIVVNSLASFTTLTSLKISGLPKSATLPLCNLIALGELEISDCPELMSIECSFYSSFSEDFIYEEGLQSLSSLKRFSLTDCPKLHFSASERLPPTLKYMSIDNCPLLMGWCIRNSNNLICVSELWINRNLVVEDDGKGNPKKKTLSDYFCRPELIKF